MKKLTLGLFTVLAFLLAGMPVMAENLTRVGDIAIHHNAFLTVELSPEIASRYGFKRSPNRALVNISLIREKPGTTGEALQADVKVMARNLRGQVRQIPLREVKEEKAVYYIGDFLVENQEQVSFTIEAKPKGSEQVLHASFKQQFFTR